MKKKYIIFSIVTLVLLVALITSFNYFKTTNTYIDDSVNNQTKITKGISMNLEQTAGAGDYKTVTRSSWPTEGYKFNTELSRCENGGEINWDDINKKVIVTGNVSDKCYVYFDIWIPSIAAYCTSGTDLATCVKNFGDQGPSVSNIYIHNSALTNGAGDNSYRYAGANPNNFICFGSDATTCPTDNLYRIIGVIDGKVKLIKYDYMTTIELGTDGDYSKTYKEYQTMYGTYKGTYGDGAKIGVYYWNNATQKNTWSESNLNKTNLNRNFINYLGSTWANKIATTTWKVGGNTNANIVSQIPSVAYTNEITNPVTTNTTDNATTYSAKIGLMYVSDYGFAASPNAWTLTIGSYNNTIATSSNWMYMGLFEWTISRMSVFYSTAFYVYYSGYVYNINGEVNGSKAVRASFNLESSVKYVSGTGSMSDPIRIN